MRVDRLALHQIRIGTLPLVGRAGDRASGMLRPSVLVVIRLIEVLVRWR
jgi:hypothetical protein